LSQINLTKLLACRQHQAAVAAGGSSHYRKDTGQCSSQSGIMYLAQVDIPLQPAD